MSAAVEYVRGLEEGANDQANAFRFYASVTSGKWPHPDPDFVANPERAAELDAKAVAEEANAQGWGELAGELEEAEGETTA